MSLDYDSILASSWAKILDEIERGEVLLVSEDDLRCHLFHECLVSIAATGLKPPFLIHAELDYFDFLASTR